jgi:2-keto-4-pentenoate hydratase/2-oxohepta-3-ene-1,7-dioic acid hydratase in catechol pathway
MRLIAYELGGKRSLGAQLGEELVDLTTAGLPAAALDLLQLGTAGLDAARKAVKDARSRVPLSSISYLPPVVPGKAIAVGLNYADHATEASFKVPTYPVLFHRFPSSWVGHAQPLLRPKVSEQFDYEGELAVIIGKPGRYIDKSAALNHVAGYSVFNDGSIRDYQFKSTQWMMGKNFDASGSFGPALVTADEVPAGAVGLQLRTRLNGTVLQDANTCDLVFDVATLVSTCSDAMTLQPGDVIISGTPGGVGFTRKPPIFMKPGDTCEIEIDGVGLLRNPVKAES